MVREKRIEKRREKRLKVRLPIRISYPETTEIYSHTENISRLGTYIEIEREIPLGVHLDIAIEVPAYTDDWSLKGTVRCKGDVFRCNLVREQESTRFYGLGIFFTNFSNEQDRDILSKYIDFLIVKEKQDIKQAMLLWRTKRRKRRAQKRN